MKKSNIQTIVIIILCLLCCLADNLFSQPYFGLGLGNKGMNYQLGIRDESLDLKFDYKMPMTRNDVAKVLSFQIGKQLLLTHNESDNLSLTPSIGYGWRKWKDFTEWDKGGEVIPMSDFKPVYQVEIMKQWYYGGLSVNYSYCGSNYFSIGFKFFTQPN